MNDNSSDPGGCAFAQINQYVVRDLASFMLQAVRGSAHQAGRTIGHRYWTQRNMNFVPDGSMAAWNARLRALMMELDAASKGRLMALRQKAIFLHLARDYTMLQEQRFLSFRKFCLDRPNAVDHWNAKLDKSATAVAAQLDLPANTG